MRKPEGQIAWLTGVVGVAAGAAAACWRPEAGLGLAAGAGLSLLNYLWLKAGVEAMLTAARGGAVARGGMARFLMRFGLLGVCLYAIFISHLVPFAWVLGGLFAAPAAALAVGVRQLIYAR